MNILDTIGSQILKGGDAFGRALKKISGNIEVDNQKNRDTLIANVLSAIKNNETNIVKGDPYAFQKPSGDPELGNDIGAYQVTAGELKDWSKQFTGKQIDPIEFLANPELQDSYMKSKVTILLNSGASSEEILALHRGGLTGYADPEIRAKRVKTRQEYVNKGMDFIKGLGDN